MSEETKESARRKVAKVHPNSRLREALEGGDAAGIAELMPPDFCVELALHLLLKAQGYRAANGILCLKKD